MTKIAKADSSEMVRNVVPLPDAPTSFGRRHSSTPRGISWATADKVAAFNSQGNVTQHMMHIKHASCQGMAMLEPIPVLLVKISRPLQKQELDV